METANIMLNIGGEGSAVIAKYGVTPAEVAVLRVLHGDDAVSDIDVLIGEAVNENGGARTHRQEIARLNEVYSRPQPEGGKRAPAVDMLFPGAAARVFEAFEELELPAELFKPTERATAKPKQDPLDHDGDGRKGGVKNDAEGLAGMTITALKTLADERNIDLGGATKKADIIARIEAVEAGGKSETTNEAEASENEAGEDDGIGDMDDRKDVFG